MLLIFFPHQEKLAKSIHYLISKEDQVRTQITGLQQLISQTEVRALTQAKPLIQALYILTWPVYLEVIFLFPFIILFKLQLVPSLSQQVCFKFSYFQKENVFSPTFHLSFAQKYK